MDLKSILLHAKRHSNRNPFSLQSNRSLPSFMRKVLSIRHTSSPFISGKKKMNSSPPQRHNLACSPNSRLMCCVIHTSTASPQSCPQWSLILLKKSISPITNGKRHNRLFPALLRNVLYHLTGGSTNLSADRSLPVSSAAHYTTPASSPQIPHWS